MPGQQGHQPCARSRPFQRRRAQRCEPCLSFMECLRVCELTRRDAGEVLATLCRCPERGRTLELGIRAWQLAPYTHDVYPRQA